MECRSCRELIWGRKELQVLWRVGSPDHGKKSKRERVKRACAGYLIERTLSQSPWLGKDEGWVTGSFYKWWRPKSEVLEVHAITMWPSTGEEGQMPWSRQCRLRVPRVILEETVPLFGVHLGEVAQRLREKRPGGCQRAELFNGIGTEMLAEGSKPWFQVLSVLYHKLWTDARSHVQFPANSKSATRPSPRGTVQVLVIQISKIWNFQTQACAWDKTQKYYTFWQSESSDPGMMREGIWKKLGI